ARQAGAAGAGVPRRAGEPRPRRAGTRWGWVGAGAARGGGRERGGGSRHAVARPAAGGALRPAWPGRRGRARRRAGAGAAGAGGKALAAWAGAGRLAPRDRLMLRAHELLPTPDAASDPLLATGVATPAEWALAAAVLWLAMWSAVMARARRSAVVGLAALGLVAGGLAWREAARRARPLAIVVDSGTPVRGAR